MITDLKYAQITSAGAKGQTCFLFDEQPFPDSYASSDLKEETTRTEFPYGIRQASQWLFDGIRISHTQHDYKGRFLFEKENAEDTVSLSFNLKGNCLISHLGKQYPVKSRQHNMIYSPGFSNTFNNLDLETETFTIQFTPTAFLKIIKSSNDLLTHFADQIVLHHPAVLARDSLIIHPALEKAIHDILHCKYSGGLKKIFLLSKSIEILAIQTGAYLQSTQTKDYQIKKQGDKERILYAGEYLLNTIENPPNLSELAKIAGLNEYKLKRGFKEIFHNTVFGYLSSHRLELGRQMLLDTDKTAAEIAYDLGYSSPQHFNHAYKETFGITPGEERK